MLVCAACDQENPDGFKFCGNCGAPLTEAAPAREVRKIVTIVFCDLTGSTALGDRTDPETLRTTMRGYYDEMRTILERHGGTVEKFVGDAVMAVFGVPLSREDDALRAVRAAWEMRTAVGELGLQARQAEVRQLRQEKAQLQKRIAQVGTGGQLVREARRLGLVKPGEKLYIVRGIATWRKHH